MVQDNTWRGQGVPSTWTRSSRTSRLRRGVLPRRALAEQAEDLVEQVGQQRIEGVAVQQVGDRAEEVAQQIAGARLGGDVEHDPIEVDPQPEDVEVERAELQVQDLAVARAAEQGG